MSKFKQIWYKDYYRNTSKRYNSFRFFGLPPKLRLLYYIRRAQNTKCKLFKYFFAYKAYRLKLKSGNEISWKTKMGEGLYLGHNGPRYINSEAIIGKNVNINQNVTIGIENRGPRKGCPTISDNVWIGANSVIVGKITIGTNVLIAPNRSKLIC